MTELSTVENVISWPQGQASRRASEGSLETDALAAARLALTEVDLALTWRELVQGLTRVVAGFFDQESFGLILSTPGSIPGVGAPLTGRPLCVLESFLCGCGQKSIAIELDLAPSTVALNVRMALETLGVKTRPSNGHPLLMLAASAAGRHALVPARSSYFTRGGIEMQVLTLPRPDLALRARMPAAERDVVAGLVEGRTYAEVARLRGTSMRTVANQVAAAFKRLQVSGRCELLQRLFVLNGWLSSVHSPATLPPPEALRSWRTTSPNCKTSAATYTARVARASA